MSCTTSIGTDTIALHYDVLSDFQRSVYWNHCLQKLPFTLKLHNIDIDTHTIILQIPQAPQRIALCTEGPMWQKFTAMQALNRLRIFIHPNRVSSFLDDNRYYHCLNSNRVYLNDFSGFVTYNITVPTYARVPTSMILVPRYPCLPSFQDIRPSIGIFVQVGAYNAAFKHVMKYLRVLCTTLNDKKITVVCSILDTLSDEDSTKVHCTVRSIQSMPETETATATETETATATATETSTANHVHILSVPNRGMDIGAFVQSLLYCRDQNLTFDFICKLHTKSDQTWREALCEPIVGSAGRIRHICQILSSVPSVGCCATKSWTLQVSKDAHNHDIVSQYCSMMHIPNPYHRQNHPLHQFVGGTIFWMRYSILQNLITEHADVVQYALHNFKSGYISNAQSTHTHSWERLMGILVSHYDMKFATFQ